MPLKVGESQQLIYKFLEVFICSFEFLEGVYAHQSEANRDAIKTWHLL